MRPALLIAVCLLAAVGCTNPGQVPPAPQTPPRPSVPFTELADTYDLDFVGGGSDQMIRLPSDIDASAQWAPVQSAVVGAGYDLRTHEGEMVRVFDQPLSRPHGGRRCRLMAVVASGGETIAAYVAVEGEAPGVMSLEAYQREASATQ